MGLGKQRLFKIALLLSLLPVKPREFMDRIAIICESRLSVFRPNYVYYPVTSLSAIISEISTVLGRLDLTAVLRERALAEIEDMVRQRLEHCRSVGPFPMSHNADFDLARLCYAAVRALRPARVVETGVAYGVTSAFILQAMEVNQCGELHSIDLPPLAPGAEEFVGFAIPGSLRTRWHLHRGPARKILPRIVHQLDQIDIFIHDSLHTYRNMKFELLTVAPYLSNPSIVVADDIGSNRAFQEFVEELSPVYWAVGKGHEKPCTFGVVILTT